MGRPRQYATATERQAAYRRRMKTTTIWVDRETFTRMDQAVITLQDEIWRALNRGAPLARALYRSHPVGTLEEAVAWILQQIQQAPHTSDEAPRQDATNKGETC